MKKNIILELDSFVLENIVSWLKETRFHKKYNIIVLVKHYKIERYRKVLSQFDGLKTLVYHDILNYKSNNTLDLDTYHKFVKLYLNDHVTARLIDRAGYLPDYGIGNQNAFAHYAFRAYNLLNFIKENRIDFICFRNTPHTLEEWLFVKAHEYLNIDIYTLEEHIFPWLFTIRKGYLKHTEFVIENFNVDKNEDIKDHIYKNVNIISGSYDKAIPTYEKKRLGKGALKFYNPFQNLKGSYRKPHHLFTRSKNFFYYKQHSEVFDLKNTEYVVFFLHYQPERTTLPEGYEFADQFLAVHLLSRLLPKGVKLLVKEHPTMFSMLAEPKFRSIENYKMIQELDNVGLVSMELDSFSLIDNALAVSTIKGTATLEAYIRKKPVIIFGKSNLKQEGVHHFSSIENLKQFLNDAINHKIKINNVAENLYQACVNVSVSSLPQTADKTTDYSFSKKNRENATYKIMTRFLEHILN